jgi:hypothetical protein
VAIIRNVPVFRRRRGAVLLLALAAFWLAQAIAFAHASRHVGGDAAGLPGSHAALCTDCASLLPLLVVAGVGGAVFFMAPRTARRARLHHPAVVACAAAPHPAFRPRAPPR